MTNFEHNRSKYPLVCIAALVRPEWGKGAPKAREHLHSNFTVSDLISARMSPCLCSVETKTTASTGILKTTQAELLLVLQPQTDEFIELQEVCRSL